jgi:tetratricopeptide (TPR) repeat protein
VLYNRGLLYHHLGQTELALADYSEAARLNPQDSLALYNLACLLATQNRTAEAVTSLQRALAADETGAKLNNAQTDPDFDPIRADPRFQALLAEFEND